MRHQKSVLFLLLVLCLGTQALWAQGAANAGTVAGTVTDQSGAVVNGALVSLTDVATGTPRTTNTNSSGHYAFVDVAPGSYSLSISKQGFATTKAANVQVRVGQTTTFDTGLQVGGTSVEVEVSAVASELQTMNATVGNSVPQIAIDNLPSIGRDVNTFIELQPGVNTDGSVAGAVNDQNYFSLDGGNNTNDMDGSGGVYLGAQQGLIIGDPTGGVATGPAQNGNGQTYGSPSGVMPTPQDSVEEFKVNTAGQTADFNSSAGAEIKVVTKRGTGSWHGTGYEYYKDNNWSSNYWQNNQLNYIPGGHINLPSYHYSRFGAAIGGPIIPKEILGGKTYGFFNYEGFRYPNSETIFRNVPSPALRLGLLTDTTTGAIDYNLNNAPVTYKGVTYPANYGCLGLCDPLGKGLNPLVSQIWSKYEPQANASCNSINNLCDGANILGFAGNLNTPISSNFAVARVDHDFSSKQHLMASYRYYRMNYSGDDQVDIGGFFPGDTIGVPASLSSDPIQDWYLVVGLTSNITANITNDFHYSYLRNWWAWSRAGAPPQIPGLGGALELMSGQSDGKTQDLGPFNVNNQQIRRRFWDGHDNAFRDDVSMLKGNHLFQFGGYYQHNFDYHQRNDSGGTINAYPVYSLGNNTHGGLVTGTLAACGAKNAAGKTTTINNCDALAANDLGIVSIASQMFTRTGTNLALNPPLSNAFDKSTIPYYNVYFSDTWHLKPTITLAYGLGYALEMPPTEQEGKQTVLVDAANEPISIQTYLTNRRNAALAGRVYNPELGFALVGNAANGLKYPYNPYYGQFSPRVAVAWSPQFDVDTWQGKVFGHDSTVIRGGYGRIYGRTNGVDQVLVPLLGLGLEQPLACNSNAVVGGAWSCVNSTWSTAFRVGSAASGTGGPTVPLASLATPTLPQPVYPGFNNPASANPEGLDPNFRANYSDAFNVTLQRQINRNLVMEVGYIGRRIRNEFEPIETNPVPYMMTLGGQQFAQAYKNMILQYCGGVTGMGGGGCALKAGAVTPQPFFEASLKGTGYCTGFSSCTAAVVSNEGGAGGNLANAQVWGIWSDLDSGVGCPAAGCKVVNGNVGAFNFPRSLQSTPIPGSPYGTSGAYTSGAYLNSSHGYSNYNAAFVSFKMNDWHGMTMQSNLTWAKALGTAAFAQSSSVLTALDPFNLQEQYGTQPYDRRLVYNVFVVYSPPFFKGQSGIKGRVLGGWTFASVFAAGTGLPNQVYTTFADYQSFGACDGVGCAPYNSENAVPINRQNLHTSAHYCTPLPACPGQAPGNGYPVNAFSNGALEATNWRNPILGLDTRDGGTGFLTGLSYWNMDFSVKKDVRVAESVSLEFQGVFANILNHDQWFDGYYSGLFNTSGFGSLGGQANPVGPRNIEIGARVRF